MSTSTSTGTGPLPTQADEAIAAGRRALLAATTRRHKYGARPTVYNGQRFDSQAEAAYAQRLDLLKAAGAIREWGRAAAITLVPGTRKERITYTPDFWVAGADGAQWYVDVKGAVTREFRLKLKLLRYTNPTLVLKVIGTDGQELAL